MKQISKELIKHADLHTRTVQAWLSSRSPDAVCFDGIGVDVNSTGLPVPLLNLALSKDYPPGTTEIEIDDEVKQVKRFFDKREVPWYWWLGPHPKPSNMNDHITRHGLALDKEPLPAMIASLPAEMVSFDDQIQIWQACTKSDLAAASTIRRIAFRFPKNEVTSYFEDMRDDWLRGDPARLYLARIGNGPPAAIGALITGAGLPGVYVMATLPNWKRRGLGKAILSKIMKDAAKDEHPYIILTASRFGYPLYQQFGFEEIFCYEIYSYPKNE
jgi:GNAT superfamily N-acetyltransferase